MTDEQKVILYTMSEEYLGEDMLSDIAGWVDEYCHSFCYGTDELFSYRYTVGNDRSRLTFMETFNKDGMVIYIWSYKSYVEKNDPAFYLIVDPWCWVPTRQQIRLIFARFWYDQHKSQFE